VLLAGLLLSAAACSTQADRPAPAVAAKEEPAGEPFFEDVTKASGIDFSYRNGEDSAKHLAILESLGGGAALIDYDGDGLPDVFLPGGGYYTGPDKKQIVGAPCKLYRNLGGGRFQDVTAAVGLDRLAGGAPWFYTHGAAVGDYDRDGRPDLLVTGWGRVALFRNVGGTRFEDVTAKAGLDKGITWATSAAFGDLDGDGWPDLYVCQYVDWSWKKHPRCQYDAKTDDVCPPKNFFGLPHKVFRNTGRGTFADVSREAGLHPGGGDNSKGLGVILVDLDGDGRPDVYVANDTVDKFLYLNRSTPGKIRLHECGMDTGAARDEMGNANGSMGLDAGDYDGSGKPALWVTNYENEQHGLYRNDARPGLPAFNFQTSAAGLAAMGQKHVGWGTAFLDLELDGRLSLFVSHGHAIRFPTNPGVTRKQKPALMLNMGGGRFKDASRRIGRYGDSPHLGRGVAFGDLDNDGRPDMVLNPTNEPAAVLRGVGGKGKHWLGVALRGKGNADVTGAKLEVRAGGRTLTRFARAGGSYLSSNDPRHVFGLADETRAGRLTVTWPDRTVQHFDGLAVDRYHRITQGQDAPGR
jgi:hypothetical protein